MSACASKAQEIIASLQQLYFLTKYWVNGKIKVQDHRGNDEADCSRGQFSVARAGRNSCETAGAG